MPVHYARRAPRIDPETACSGVECTAANAFDLLVVLLWIGAFALAVGTLLIPRARDVCEKERARTREELRAFDRFADRVSKLDPTPTGGPSTRTVVGATSSLASVPDDGGLTAVRKAYRRTVMSVSHYEEEYGESFLENVSEEFDPEVAAALTEGGRLTPQVQRAVVERAFESRNRRERFLEVLSEESESLERTREDLSTVESTLRRMNDRPLSDRSYGDLEDAWDRLDDLEMRVESTVRERQETARSLGGGSHRFADPWTMYAYLYRPLPTVHPALADGTRVLELLETAKRRVALSLTTRV